MVACRQAGGMYRFESCCTATITHKIHNFMDNTESDNKIIQNDLLKQVLNLK